MTKQLDFTRDSFINFVKSLDETTVDVQPEGFNNTIRWHVGHVLVVAEKFLFGYPEQSTQIPANYHDLFQPGTKPADWTLKGPALSEIIHYLEDQISRINALTEDYYATKLPFTLPFGNFETYGDLYGLSIHHEAEHLGQIKAMKRIIEASK